MSSAAPNASEAVKNSWGMYNKDYVGQRYSLLAEIDTDRLHIEACLRGKPGPVTLRTRWLVQHERRKQ